MPSLAHKKYNSENHSSCIALDYMVQVVAKEIKHALVKVNEMYP